MGFKIKGNEKLIGAIVGVSLTVVAGLFGLSSDAFKEGFCGSSVSVEKTGEKQSE